MMTQDFSKDFDYLINRIFVKKERTIFSRYADGELSLILGREVGNNTQAFQIDKWNSPNFKTQLGIDLLKTLDNNSKDKFYAISCACCDPSGKSMLLKLLQDRGISIDNITYSNLWINGNYKKFKNAIQNIDEEVVVIANKQGLVAKYPFIVDKFIPIEDDCVNFWEYNKDIFLENLSNISSKSLLYLISAGPLSEIIIEFLSNLDINNNARYIDVGSALDEFTKGYITRPYMDPSTMYFYKSCKF